LIVLAERFAGRRVVVIGDVIGDEFLYGNPARISREAPVLILEHDCTTVLPGGAGNAASNAGALGGDVRLVGLVGARDRDLMDGLRPRVDTSRVLRPADYRAPVKTRILAGGMHTARQQIVRVDRGPAGDPRAAAADVERAALEAVDDCDAVLVSDYGFGLVTPPLFARLRERLAGRRSPIPTLVDSRHHLTDYQGCTACTPNESEAAAVLGAPIGDDPERLERAGRTLLDRTAAGGVVVTRGSRGMAVFVPGRPTEHIPIFGSDEVADVTGAGDTVVATLTLALAAGGSLYEAARLANYAGGLAVTKRGTATVTGAELVMAIRGDLDREKGA
jgi:rfaE bifunctional protein kinase chain/domain